MRKLAVKIVSKLQLNLRELEALVELQDKYSSDHREVNHDIFPSLLSSGSSNSSQVKLLIRKLVDPDVKHASVTFRMIGYRTSR